MLNVIEEKIMVNPINESLNMNPIDLDSRLNAKQQKAQGASENIFSQDSVSLSSTSKQLEALKASLRDEPAINEARVLYFKAEIELGNYQIHSDKIAMKMLNNVEMA